MSTIFTKLYDSSANTRAVAGSVIPTQTSSGNSSGYLTQDQLVPFASRYRFCCLSGNLGTLSSLGTSTTPVAGTIYWSDIFIPNASVLLTGIGVLNAATVGTNKWLLGLYDASGALLANTATAGTTTAGANAFQQVAFTATYTTIKPGKFFIGAQLDGVTDRFRTIATATWIDVLTTSTTGSFGTLTALTPPTTFTADTGPVAYAY